MIASLGNSREDGSWLRGQILSALRKLDQSASAIRLLKAVSPCSELRDVLAVLFDLEREGLAVRSNVGSRSYWRATK